MTLHNCHALLRTLRLRTKGLVEYLYFRLFPHAWDRRFENDVRSGKLDHFAEVALAELRSGKTSPL